MHKRLLSRLNRAITCVNAYDSDKTFDKKLMEVRRYARFMNDGECVLEEIIQIIDDTLSESRHTQKEKEQITKKLCSIQKEIKKELFDCLSS